AVLAHAPALVLEPALAARDFELHLALAGGDIGRRIEHREVLADDVGRPVALEPLCALVPRIDATLRREDEDAVVLDALDEQPKSPALLLGGPALGQIARDLGEADDLAGVVAERCDHHVGPEPRAVLAHAPALVLEPALTARDFELHLALAGGDI